MYLNTAQLWFQDLLETHSKVRQKENRYSAVIACLLYKGNWCYISCCRWRGRLSKVTCRHNDQRKICSNFK